MRAHITLTLEFDCSGEKLDKRVLRKFVTESVAEGGVSLWGAHARAEVEPGGRIVEWELDGSNG